MYICTYTNPHEKTSRMVLRPQIHLDRPSPNGQPTTQQVPLVVQNRVLKKDEVRKLVQP